MYTNPTYWSYFTPVYRYFHEHNESEANTYFSQVVCVCLHDGYKFPYHIINLGGLRTLYKVLLFQLAVYIYANTYIFFMISEHDVHHVNIS